MPLRPQALIAFVILVETALAHVGCVLGYAPPRAVLTASVVCAALSLISGVVVHPASRWYFCSVETPLDEALSRAPRWVFPGVVAVGLYTLLWGLALWDGSSATVEVSLADPDLSYEELCAVTAVHVELAAIGAALWGSATRRR